MTAPYITQVMRVSERQLDASCFPGNLPFIAALELAIGSPVTFFVGENGSGKSTLLEAIAVLAGLPISGGSTNEVESNHGLPERSALAEILRVAFRKRPSDGYFFRAELQAHFASLLDERKEDPYFYGNPYTCYGGRSLHKMSHGEAFLSVMQNRFQHGLFLLDEPESALSPQRQLALLTLMHQRVQNGKSQFIVATHSPVLLTFPGATIVSFDRTPLQTICLEETSHYKITRGILNQPEAYWKHLQNPEI